MKRSERLAKEGKVEVYIGEIATAKILTNNEFCRVAKDLRYIGTDYNALYNGNSAWANVYENEDGNLYAVIE